MFYMVARVVRPNLDFGVLCWAPWLRAGIRLMRLRPLTRCRCCIRAVLWRLLARDAEWVASVDRREGL